MPAAVVIRLGPHLWLGTAEPSCSDHWRQTGGRLVLNFCFQILGPVNGGTFLTRTDVQSEPIQSVEKKSKDTRSTLTYGGYTRVCWLDTTSKPIHATRAVGASPLSRRDRRAK